MRLSAAIMLGRHTIARPTARDIHNCAIPMALNAVGDTTRLRDTLVGLSRLYYHWPWAEKEDVCPYCNIADGFKKTKIGCIMFHVFDRHVMEDKEVTLEQMCDWIRSIEPPENEEIPAEVVSEISDVVQVNGRK